MAVTNREKQSSTQPEQTKDKTTSKASSPKSKLSAAQVQRDFDGGGYYGAMSGPQNLDTQTAPHEKEQNNLRDTAYSDVNSLWNQEEDVDPVRLNSQQNTNFAKDSRYGNLNNKDFDTTLALSRYADAYNNKPIDKIRQNYSYNAAGGSYGYGGETTGYNRPNIETQEMRQMRANERLDENQRKLDQDLQASVNAKDYNAFKKAFEQKYRIQLENYDVKKLMAQFRRQQAINDMISRQQYDFKKIYDMKFGKDLANFFIEIGGQNNLAGQIITNYVAGFPLFSRAQWYADQAMAEFSSFLESKDIPIEEKWRLLNAFNNIFSQQGSSNQAGGWYQ